MKICMVGEGAIGQQHLNALTNIDNVEVVSLVGGIASNTQDVAARFRIKHHTLELAEGLSQPGVEAVILASPTPLHFAQTKQVLLSGKHVLVEIPMADNLKEARALVDIAESSGLVAMVGHVRRFNHSHNWLHKQFSGNTFRLLHLHAQTYFMRRTNINALGQARTWTDHLLWHHACHTVDLFQYQTGEEVSQCYALQGPTDNKLGIAMDMSIGLKVPSGALCTLSLSFNNEGPLGSQYRYICDRGTFHTHNDTLFDAQNNVMHLEQQKPSLSADMPGLEVMDREFISAILEKRQSYASLQACLSAMKVLDTLENILLKNQHLIQDRVND